MDSKKFKCPCGGQETLSSNHLNDVCSVCHWEDDYVQFVKTDFAGGANFFFLKEYRALYLKVTDINYKTKKMYNLHHAKAIPSHHKGIAFVV